MILIKTMLKKDEIFEEETKFLFTEQVYEQINDYHYDKSPDFLDNTKWEKLVKLNTLKNYQNIIDHIVENQDEWRSFITNPSTTSIPGIFNELNLTRKLLILKVFHLEHMQSFIKEAISTNLTEELANINLYTIPELFEISTHMTPLILILTPGIDPNVINI
jgi:hypothetical protein